RSEVAQHLGTMRDYLSLPEPRPIDDAMVRAAHTLHGAVAMVDIPVLAAVLTPLESWFKRMRAQRAAPDAQGVAAMRDAVAFTDHVIAQFDSPQPDVPDATALSERLASLRDTLPEASLADVLHSEEAAENVQALAPAEPVAEVAQEPSNEQVADLAGFIDADAVASIGSPVTDEAHTAHELAGAERLAEEQRVAEEQRLAAERAEAERLEAERQGQERLAAEQAALEAERAAEQERAAQQAEAERVAEEQRVAAERAEAERLEAERQEQERLAAEQAELERAEAERLAAEQAEAERLAEEQRVAEEQRIAAERAEAERLEAERHEQERLAAERAEAERAAEEQRIAAERAEAERLEAERQEQERIEAERLAAEQEAERQEQERLAAEKAEADRIAAAKLAEERRQAAVARANVLAALPPFPDDPQPEGKLDLPDADPDLLEIFTQEGTELLDHSDGLLVALRDAPEQREPVAGLQRDLHTLKGGARVAGIAPIGDLAHVMETLLEAVADGRRE